MTINQSIRIGTKEYKLKDLPKKQRCEIIEKMNIRAVEKFNYILREKTA